ALARLARRRLEIVDRAYRRPVDHLAVEKVGAARSDHAAAGPVDRHALAHRAAEQVMDRDAERLAPDVETGIEDCAGGVLVEAARDRAGERIERGLDAADRARVLADQELAHAVDRGGDAGAAMLLELRPAGEARVGAHLEERVDFPAAIDVKLLEFDDLHALARLPCVRHLTLAHN